MAYVQTCYAGYPNPAGRSGRFEVCGFKAAVLDTTAASRVILWDDSSIDTVNSKCGNVHLGTEGPGITVKSKIADVKGLANGDGYIEHCFPEPLKTRYGISVYINNVVSVELYVR